MGEFMTYDASQWIYEATLVPITKAVSRATKVVRRDGVRQFVVLAGIALGVTEVHREVPPAQLVSVWESPGVQASADNVVPIGYWSRLVKHMQEWKLVDDEAKLPDFDSLA